MLKSAISKVFGVYDSFENVIHIHDGVAPARRTFLKLHETGHHELPTHCKVFRLFQDCEKTLAPEIADQFEREANNFARFALFQGDAFGPLRQIKAAPALAFYCSQIMWHRIRHPGTPTPPTDRDLALSVIDHDGVHELAFPCRLSADGRWRDKRGRTVEVNPTHWREWPLAEAK